MKWTLEEKGPRDHRGKAVRAHRPDTWTGARRGRRHEDRRFSQRRRQGQGSERLGVDGHAGRPDGKNTAFLVIRGGRPGCPHPPPVRIARSGGSAGCACRSRPRFRPHCARVQVPYQIDAWLRRLPAGGRRQPGTGAADRRRRRTSRAPAHPWSKATPSCSTAGGRQAVDLNSCAKMAAWRGRAAGGGRRVLSPLLPGGDASFKASAMKGTAPPPPGGECLLVLLAPYAGPAAPAAAAAPAPAPSLSRTVRHPASGTSLFWQSYTTGTSPPAYASSTCRRAPS